MRTTHGSILTSPHRCIAVHVIRKDGVNFGLTDADAPFVFGGVTYSPVNGVGASAVIQQAGTSPGDLETTTVESAILSQVTAADLRAGLYQDARVWVYEVDPTDTSKYMVVNQYMLADAEIGDTSRKLSLKELHYRLKNSTGRLIRSKCDVCKAWTGACDPNNAGGLRAFFSHSRTVTAVIDLFTIEFGSDTHAAGYFTAGEVIWTAGANAGLEGEVKLHTVPVSGTARLVLNSPMGYPVSVGDVATLVRGCDRSQATCKSIPNSANPSGTNIENFQGFSLPIPDEAQIVNRGS